MEQNGLPKKNPLSLQLDLSKFSAPSFDRATDEEKRQQDVMSESTTFFKDGMRKLFAATAARLMNKRVWVTSRIVPNGDHCEACWEEQIPVFMHILQYNRD